MAKSIPFAMCAFNALKSFNNRKSQGIGTGSDGAETKNQGNTDYGSGTRNSGSRITTPAGRGTRAFPRNAADSSRKRSSLRMFPIWLRLRNSSTPPIHGRCWSSFRPWTLRARTAPSSTSSPGSIPRAATSPASSNPR